jgi:hypothetical protein
VQCDNSGDSLPDTLWPQFTPMLFRVDFTEQTGIDESFHLKRGCQFCQKCNRRIFRILMVFISLRIPNVTLSFVSHRIYNNFLSLSKLIRTSVKVVAQLSVKVQQL